MDYLAIGIHEIGSLSGCRMERLVNCSMSGLPAFLTPEGGLNSGFMIAHCAAVALGKQCSIKIEIMNYFEYFIVSENKVLCHPSSVDSISTSAGQEDHVSMGGWSARKALKVIDNVEVCKQDKKKASPLLFRTREKYSKSKKLLFTHRH